MAAHSFEDQPALSGWKVLPIAEASLNKREAGKSKITEPNIGGCKPISVYRIKQQKIVPC